MEPKLDHRKAGRSTAIRQAEVASHRLHALTAFWTVATRLTPLMQCVGTAPHVPLTRTDGCHELA